MKKVITYGTFDLFHQGHYNILKRAKEHGDYLIVGVTSESFDIERGKIGVRDSLAVRIENVKKTGFADEIIIEEFQGQKIQDVQKYDVDVLVIGSDWYGKFDYLKPYCEVVYLERTKSISSTQLRLKDQILNMGMMVDSDADDGFVLETKYVSGVHVDRVFCEDAAVAEALCASKELNGAYTSMETFFDGVDAVYVSVDQCRKYEYVKAALLAGKHVLCHFPMADTEEQTRELVRIARDKQAILMDCLRLAYLHAFNQMMWMVESGTIGKVVNVKCAVSDTYDQALSYDQAVAYTMYVAYRIFRAEPFSAMSFVRQMEGTRRYMNVLLKTQKASVLMEMACGVDLQCSLTIMGEKGQITVPDDWWNTGYFELKTYDSKGKKRYSYNYEGTGMRYILRELMIMLREKNYEPLRFSYEDEVMLSSLSQQIMKGNDSRE